jgi:hypothetical protein
VTRFKTLIDTADYFAVFAEALPRRALPNPRDTCEHKPHDPQAHRQSLASWRNTRIVMHRSANPETAVPNFTVNIWNVIEN